MYLHQLFMAASAAAFLVVPETIEPDEGVFSALPFDAYAADIPSHALAQTLDVPCHGCKEPHAHINMELAVEDGTRLTLNGFELYPSADPWRGDLTATVAVGEQYQDQLLGYALAVEPVAYDQAQSLEVIKVSMRIIEVGYQFIDDIPTIDVTLIKAPTNEILVGDVRIGEPSRPACGNMLCQLKQGLDKAWKGLKTGCTKHHGQHGQHGEHGKPHAEVDGETPRPGHHAHHAHGHNWLGLLRTIVVNIALPVLTGITVGVGFAVLIMAFCSLIALLARVRRSSRKTSCPKVRPTEPADEEEKAGLMETEVDHQEPPPEYADRQRQAQM